MLEELIKQIVEETVMLTLKKTGAFNHTEQKVHDIMNPQQLSNYLGMSINWVYQHTKELPHEKRGRKTLFIRLEIDQWREQQRNEKHIQKQKTIKVSSTHCKKGGFYKIV